MNDTNKNKWKDMPTDILTCKYYTDDDYMKTLSDDERISMLKEICRRRHEEREAWNSINH